MAFPHRLSELFEKILKETSDFSKYGMPFLKISSMGDRARALQLGRLSKDYFRMYALILIGNPLAGNVRCLTMQKRTEITIETERFTVVSRRHDGWSVWCNHCSDELPVLTVDEAATATSQTPLVIFRLVEAGRLHFAVAPDGRHFICPKSLASEKRHGVLTSRNFT